MKNWAKNILTFTIPIVLSCDQLLFAQSQLVKTLYFKSDSYHINKKCKVILDKIAKRCSSDTSFYLKIFGYTDKVGYEKHNDELSEKRATTVFNYLKSRTNIDSIKVYIMWLGESDDTYDLHFSKAHSQERCVDIG